MMTGIENQPDIEIIDNEKIMSEKINNCETNCESNNTKLEGLLMLIKYDLLLDNHDIDLAFDKNNNTFYVICDTIVLRTPLDIGSLEHTLSNIVKYIQLGEEKTFRNLWGQLKGFDLEGNSNKRVIVKNGIGGTAQREQIVLNKNLPDQNQDIKIYNNNISENMYLFLQKILDPNGNWEINGVCEGEGIAQACRNELGTGADSSIVNTIETIRKANPEEIPKFD